MPYFLSQTVRTDSPGLWGEGSAYQPSVIYDIASDDPTKPPVHYCAHLLKPHSIAHLDFSAHINRGGKTCEQYFEGQSECFWGRVVVLRLRGGRWISVAGSAGSGNGELSLWRIERDELVQALVEAGFGETPPDKLFITPDAVASTNFHSHDPNFVFVLSEAAASWLISNPNFNAFGTSWKSADFEPGSRARPVHKVLLRQAVLYEFLDLSTVPEGEYFLSGAPLRLSGASESPVTPVLFGLAELQSALRF